MKKLIAILLALITVCSMLAACGGGDNSSKESGTSSSEGNKQPASSAQSQKPATTPSENDSSPVVSSENKDSSTSAESKPASENSTSEASKPSAIEDDLTSRFDPLALYVIEASDGTKLEWDYNYIQPATGWQGTVWSVDHTEQGGKTVFMFHAGDEFRDGLEISAMMPGGGVKIGIVGDHPTNKQGWLIEETEVEGQYVLVAAGNKKFSLACKNGKFTVELKENNSTTFSFTKVENPGTSYAQWVSEKRNIIVRLPVDVVDQIYNRVKRNYTSAQQETLKERIEERMQLFAEDVQKTYDAYIDLTGFVPYKRIIVKAFEHQNVMAGVVGNDCNIYVNVDWYVDDMEKMWLRWEEGKEDYNFCILHEMGHMFDWNRGWNFESEMEADLKATYVLYSHKDDVYSAYAAPAEYPAAQCFNYDTIELAYKGLSGDMPYKEAADGTITYTYSIYRAAQRYTEYMKACEASEQYVGYEALKKTFHWFQDNGYTTDNLTSKERFDYFNEKLIEYTGGAKPEDYFQQRGTNKEWKAMCARGEGIESSNGK